jgi:TRAP transporter 4TM/12TM fusion protein
MQEPETKETDVVVEMTRFNVLPLPMKAFFAIMSGLGLFIALSYVFNISLAGYTMLNFTYFTIFITIFASLIFLILPARRKDLHHMPWYDYMLLIATLAISFYFFLNSEEMSIAGWNNIPLGVILGLLILEGGRRTGGNVFLVVTLFLGAYPLFADYMPGLLWGVSYDLPSTIESMIFTEEGLMGITTKVVAVIIIGFLVFAGVLISSGAGDFFLNLANAIFGKFRGGPAKVSVVSSGLFGSLSGSIFSNILGTGSVTIPTMKKIGYPGHYAGAIEACASTGGVLMPPVMGAVAFVMAEMLNVDYADIVVAATIPSLLFYFGLLLQVDAFAGKANIKGLSQDQIPSMKETLKVGWPFIAVFVFLMWGLLYMRWSYMTPWYASGLMIVLSFYRKETRMTPKRLLDTLFMIGKLVTQSTAIILPIGFIMCGLNITGASGSFTSGLIALGSGNIFLVLLLGLLACYILGMAGMVISAYIFLGVTLAPAAIQIADLNEMSVHLFIIYYAMLSAITPPVAAGAFLAATLAGAGPMKTAFTAMRLGVVIYFIPFFFVFNPALVFQGPLFTTLYLVVLCMIGIVYIAAGMEGYLIGVGKAKSVFRPFLVIAGFLIAFPQPAWWWQTSIVGGVLAGILTVIMWIDNRKTEKSQAETSRQGNIVAT